jgi:hypothetical protein
LSLVIAVLRPFWARLTEGLADLVVEMIRCKAKRRWPSLFEDHSKIPAGQNSDDPDDGPQGTKSLEPGGAAPEGETATGDEHEGGPQQAAE